MFFVTDLGRALQFYRDALGFAEAWRYEEGGNVVVAQMNYQDCEIIFAVDERRAGASRLFIALEDDEMKALQSCIEDQKIPATHGWWGYRVIEIRDPDGNELFFPLD